MPLDRKLMSAPMQWSCPDCSHAIERPGTWFVHRRRVACDKCGYATSFGYDEKVKLFCRTARRVAGERKRES